MRIERAKRLESEHSVARLCQVLEISRSGFYARQARGTCARRREDARLLALVRASHEQSTRRYGSPRVHEDLRALGERTSRKRVARLMSQEGLVARRRRRFRATTQSRHGHELAPNRLARRFAVRRVDRVWTADITHIWTREGWLYLAVVMDLCSRRIVGWQSGARLDESLTLQALEKALATRRPSQRLLHHSDRGRQYASARYRGLLARHGILRSMSRKGDCWDNAPTESFFSTLEFEQLRGWMPKTRAEATGGLFEYIEGFYNRRRRHSSLGYQSPEEFERRAATR